MGKFFETKIRHTSLTFSPFTSEQMSRFGEIAVSSIRSRINLGLTVTDSIAPPLVEHYARRKIIRGRNPIRDWMFRGATMGALQVKAASEDRVTIGFTTTQSNQIVAAQQRRAKQWGVSPKDWEKVVAAVRGAYLGQFQWQGKRLNRALDKLIA
jgi:hypothetical protein